MGVSVLMNAQFNAVVIDPRVSGDYQLYTPVSA